MDKDLTTNPHSLTLYNDLFSQDPDAFILGLKAGEFDQNLIDEKLNKKIKKHQSKQEKLKNKANTKLSFKYLMYFIKPNIKYFVLMFLLTIVIVGLTVFSTFVLQRISEYVGYRLNSFKDINQSDYYMNVLGQTIGFIAGIYFIIWLGQLALEFSNIRIAQRISKNIRRELFRKIQNLPVSYFDKNKTGDLMSRFTNDVNNITKALTGNVTEIMNGVILVIGMTVAMFIESSYMSLVVIMILPILFLGFALALRNAGPIFGKQQELLGKLNAFSNEMIQGQEVLDVYDYQQHVFNEYKELSKQLKKATYSGHKLTAFIFPWSSFFESFAMLFMTFVGILFYLNPNKDLVKGFAGIGGYQNPVEAIATITTFLMFFRLFLQPFTRIGDMMSTFMSAIAGASRAFEIIDLKEEFLAHEKLILKVASLITTNRNDPLNQSIYKQSYDLVNDKAILAKHFDAPENKEEVTVSGGLKIKDLSFSYVENKPILKNINFEVQPGETIAIVGPTGSGKSTFINLLTKFYDIKDGDILFDDWSIKEIEKTSMRNNISIVMQETFLFSGSIKENIRIAKLDASDEEIIQAAKIANAHHFIMQLENGYDTVLENNGDILSQGQKQLISIARAVLSHSNFLILDEATSSIDTKTEKDIQEAMLNLMKMKTSFVIAHRLSTIQNADQILVLKDGEIIESGKHNELLAKHGFYYDLVHAQFKEE